AAPAGARGTAGCRRRRSGPAPRLGEGPLTAASPPSCPRRRGLTAGGPRRITRTCRVAYLAAWARDRRVRPDVAEAAVAVHRPRAGRPLGGRERRRQRGHER